MANEDLRRDVAAELLRDPEVDSEEIAGSAADGTVTLRGAVGSFRQKREAGKAVGRVYRVTGVSNELRARILSQGRREDPELRGDVLRALMLDSLIPPTIDVQVSDGVISLTGTSERQHQRDEAEFTTANVPGVLGIKDAVILTTSADGQERSG